MARERVHPSRCWLGRNRRFNARNRVPEHDGVWGQVFDRRYHGYFLRTEPNFSEGLDCFFDPVPNRVSPRPQIGPRNPTKFVENPIVIRSVGRGGVGPPDDLTRA